MRKLFLLVAAAAVLLCTCTAYAQQATEPPAFEGIWVEFEDGFGLLLPDNWDILGISHDESEMGVFYSAANPEMTQGMRIAWQDLAVEAPIGVDALLARIMSQGYADAIAYRHNDLDFVLYVDTTLDISVVSMLDAEGTGAYFFMFYPASDAAFADTATSIARSIAPRT